MIDEEQLTLLLLKRGNYIRDIAKLTDELADAQSRHDTVSMDLILNMRQDTFAKCDSNWTAILEMGENSEEDGREIRRLVRSDPKKEIPRTDTEKKLFDIRSRNQDMIAEIQKKEERINLVANGSRSFYEGNGSESI